MAREKGYTKKNFLKGIIIENPLFVSILGTCPALATTKSVEAAIGMGGGGLQRLLRRGGHLVWTHRPRFQPFRLRNRQRRRQPQPQFLLLEVSLFYDNLC